MAAETTFPAGPWPSPHKKARAALQTPLDAPLPTSKPKERTSLTGAHQAKYEWLLSQVESWIKVPSTKVPASPLTEAERMWLTHECLLRYLRATKWHPKNAEKRILDTLVWRRDYGVDGLTAEHISPESETGKQIILGYDNEGRPCHYLSPGRQNTAPSPRQVQHLVYMIERVLDLLPPGQETLSLMINFKGSKSQKNTAPGIQLAKEVLHILQHHYPERLGKALIINVPWIVWGFFKLITPFIDPLTREKLKFNEDMNQYVPSEQLWTEFNGKLEFEYDHATYWPALTKLCEQRREARKKRWASVGHRAGEFEDFLNCTTETGVAGVAAVKEVPEVKNADEAQAADAIAQEKVNEQSEATRTPETAVAETDEKGDAPEEKEVHTKEDARKVEDMVASLKLEDST